jgi:phosphomevalonate kinase
MPDPSKLSTASGQLGPVCSVTGKALTFGEAIVLDGEYLCLEAYIEKTGAAPSTEGKEVQALDLD